MTLLDLRHGASDELDEIVALARPLTDPAELDPLLARVGGARFVLLGEASHGTSDYYRWQAQITRRSSRSTASRSWPSRGTGRTASP